ncbi:type II toxin-antitoxin system HigB family toxin [Cryomorpha ignava]|uniref:Type II toxin-antitoxin system HigB family toxin n=1 Tax=Cryomorpha ignava TaxID=101383 RepID=A0A7K3WTD9_9FLAO|nr:type II toxin-antitoxin system HigB family toxin [Cryomorpha ignava]
MSKCFDNFFEKLKYVDWEIPQNITQTFKSADLITCGNGQLSRIVFNVGRNKYRMVCGYFFGRTEVILYVKFVGTHKEYDSIDICSFNLFNDVK